MPTIYISGYFGPRSFMGTKFWQLVRVRLYSPNGIMPSIYIS